MVEDGTTVKVSGEESESGTLNSEQIEMEIAQILEKIDRFTQLVIVFNTGTHCLVMNSYKKDLCFQSGKIPWLNVLNSFLLGSNVSAIYFPVCMNLIVIS